MKHYAIVSIMDQIKINPVPPENFKSRIHKFSKIANWVEWKNKQHLSKVLLNSFPMNGVCS